MNILVIGEARLISEELSGHDLSSAPDVAAALPGLEILPDLVIMDGKTFATYCANRRGRILRVGDLVIDRDRKQATFGGRRVGLSPTQFRLLKHLALHAGQVVSYGELLQEVWGRIGDDREAQDLIRSHVRDLRRKLGWTPDEYLFSARGFGYILKNP